MTREAIDITEELFLLSQSLLEDAGLYDKLRERRPRIDGAFNKKIVKNSFEKFMNTKWPYKMHAVMARPQGV